MYPLTIVKKYLMDNAKFTSDHLNFCYQQLMKKTNKFIRKVESIHFVSSFRGTLKGCVQHGIEVLGVSVISGYNAKPSNPLCNAM